MAAVSRYAGFGKAPRRRARNRKDWGEVNAVGTGQPALTAVGAEARDPRALVVYQKRNLDAVGDVPATLLG